LVLDFFGLFLLIIFFEARNLLKLKVLVPYYAKELLRTVSEILYDMVSLFEVLFEIFERDSLTIHVI
jgi:hypothetical protein